VAQYKDFKNSQESRPLLTRALQAATFSYWDTVPSSRGGWKGGQPGAAVKRVA